MLDVFCEAHGQSLPEQLGDGAARVLGFALVLGDGSLDRDGQTPPLSSSLPVRRNPAQPGLGVADLRDVLGVSRVVGRGVQDSAGPQPVGDQRHGGRLQQPTLVVARLGPRIGEEHPHPGQRVRLEHVLEDVDAVAADQPDVADAFAVDRGEQLSKPAAVNLHRHHVDVGLGLCHRQRRRARSAADFEHDRGRTPEPRLGVQQGGGTAGVAGVHADLGPQPIPRGLLRTGQRGAAGTEAGDPGM